MTMSPRKAVAVVVGLVFLAITAFAAYLSLTGVRSNDACLWDPRLWSTANGRQTTTVNITASESWEFQYVRALIWVDDARAGETSPLADGASGGPLTFSDAGGDQRISSGDRFMVETSPGRQYRIDLFFGSCVYPS